MVTTPFSWISVAFPYTFPIGAGQSPVGSEYSGPFTCPGPLLASATETPNARPSSAMTTTPTNEVHFCHDISSIDDTSTLT